MGTTFLIHFRILTFFFALSRLYCKMSEVEAKAAAEEQETEETTEEAGKNETPKEEESTATFEPVVKLEEVEIKSGEEDEEVLYAMRSKLFIFGETLLDKGTGKKSWKERGIGEVRLLRHREHQRIRVSHASGKNYESNCKS